MHSTVINATSLIPITASTVHRMILNCFGEVSFIEYVVCPSCNSITSSMTVRLELTIGYQKYFAI